MTQRPGPTGGEHTRAVHTPPPPVFAQAPMGLPIYRTAAFAFDSAEEYEEVLAGRAPGFTYSRIDNPTAATFAGGVAWLEGAGAPGEVVGEAFASGMAAISAVMMGHLSAGDHVLCASEVYGGTWSLLSGVLSRFGVATTFADLSDPAGARAGLTDRTRLVWAETLANPSLSVADLSGLAGVAHAAGALLAVDSTFASPVICRPLEHGADLVVHSATKYLGGHSDVTGGVVVGRPDLLAPVRHMRVELGGSLAPDEAFLLHRGLATLPLRMARHSASAQALAEAMLAHPAVTAVHYPGLPGHRDHQRAMALFDSGRCGGVLSVDIAGDRAAGRAFCDRLRIGRNATSLAGTHTKVSHVASTTHRQLDDAALRAAGIGPATVRVSVGLEDVEDLIADCRQALDSLR
ncbi:MAG: aminotransferase class I/II-fold pyridoxal phosphate-dependent enzyme [Actinobacteria bacterium]|nr:aminotransferase class I/II-fold pyridoxal phosphate-dependent enzyme [Actinomycetota bacterium]